MINKELFDKTVSILVNAYQKDLLLHDNCAACGIGNIISANCGFKVEYLKNESFFIDGDNVYDASEWYEFFGTSKELKKKTTKRNFLIKNESVDYFLVSSHFNPKASKRVKKWIAATGYNMVQLAKLEYAFEFNDIAGKDATKEERMFNGLMGMVDSLMEIHEASIDEIKSAKELFILTEAG